VKNFVIKVCKRVILLAAATTLTKYPVRGDATVMHRGAIAITNPTI